METSFTELASTDLDDHLFFEEVFLHYMHYVYPTSKTACIQDLAQIRHRYNQKDEHTQYHLRDKIENVLARYHKMEQSVLVAELIQMKRRIAQLERVNTD